MNEKSLQKGRKMVLGGGPNEKVNIGIIMPTWVGDACMATPALNSVRESFPSAHLCGVMSPVVCELLSANDQNAQPWFNETLLLHKSQKRKRNGTVSKYELVSKLRKQKLDLLVLLTNSFWSAAVGYACGARTRIGYDRDARKWLLTHAVPVPTVDGKPKPISAVDYYLELTCWVGGNPRSKRMRLTATLEDQGKAEVLWRQVGFDSDRETVVINSNSAKDGSRVWPFEKVRELAIRLATESGIQVLVHCGPGEEAAANRVASEANHPRVVSMGKLSELPIGLSRGVLAKASVVVSTDSGARHMAVALDRPVVSLFGPTDQSWTKTYNLPEVGLSEDLECRACYKSRCPLSHHRCMQEISVQRVLDAVLKQIPEHSRSQFLPIAA